MSINQNDYEKNNRLAALKNNVEAIRSVASSVKGTIGPRGMDCMIVDDHGNAIITNDGITILKSISATHPAARLLINAVITHQREVGDGTTTLTLLLGTLLDEALNVAEKGVPIHKIISGIKLGLDIALKIVDEEKILIQKENFNLLKDVAYISARENHNITRLIYEASKILGLEKLKDEKFSFCENIEVLEDYENKVFNGIIIDRNPTNKYEDFKFDNCKVLVLNDSLDVDYIDKGSLSTEVGFKNYINSIDTIKSWAQKIVDLKVDILFCDRGVNKEALHILSAGGVIVVDRVLNNQLLKIARYSGARLITKLYLNKEPEEIKTYLGYVQSILNDSQREHINLFFPKDRGAVSIIISAATPEVINEKQRIAKDACSSLLHAARSGVVSGGGAFELFCATKIKEYADGMTDLSKYGIECVIKALRKPFIQMIENAGYNSLEILEKIDSYKNNNKEGFFTIDFDNGNVIDANINNLYDPATVKSSVLKKAKEISETILKINLILKGRTS